MIKWIARHTATLLREEWFLRVHLRSSLFKLIWFIILSLKTLFVALYWRHKLTSCHLVWYVRSIHANLLSFCIGLYSNFTCKKMFNISLNCNLRKQNNRTILSLKCLSNFFVWCPSKTKHSSQAIWLIYDYPGFPRVSLGGLYLRVGYFRKSVQNSTGIKKPNRNAELFCKL